MTNIYSWKDKSFLPTPFGKDYIDNEDNIDSLIEIFMNNYSHVKAYHLCRPISIESYRDNGIKIGSTELLIKNANEILNKLNINITKNKIHSVLNELGYREGNLYLALDDNYMHKNAGHYAIYGSERLIAVFERLGISKEKLKTVGKPTVIHINLPIESIYTEDLRSLVIEINNSIIDMNKISNFAFLQNKSISPNLICEFVHPNEIVNWHSDRRIYRV
ncbi:hypothetical protein VT25_02025 [Photobacterium leiognathi subsp. mandapamensis]|nr:hypothetical protein VT25_02025 [Photobacterium leiognathi subsp. mandapamensis]